MPADEDAAVDAAPEAATDANDAATSLYFPDDDATWAKVDPASAGWDAAKLQDALDFAASRSSRALVILLEGKILAEGYWGVDASFERDIASAQKSIVSLLVGLAIDRGLVHHEDTITSFLGAGWSNADAASEAKITVRHLLTMTSGLDTKLASPVPPGSAWLYNTDAYHRLQLVLEKVSGLGIESLSHQWLFDPIGAKNSHWAERAGLVDSKGLPYWGLSMTARDMARIGLCALARGKWRDARVLPEAYVHAATQPSQMLNPSYGYLWWLNGQSFVLSPQGVHVDGPLVPHAPPDMVAALGKDDQKFYVSVTTGLVVTRLGAQAGTKSSEALSDFDDLLWTKILAARPAK